MANHDRQRASATPADIEWKRWPASIGSRWPTSVGMPGRIHRNPHVSILCHEPGYEKLEKRLAAENGPFFVSSLVKFEASHALARQKSKDRRPTPELLKEASNAVEAFVEDIAADEIAISPEVGRLAIDASTRYGKAVGHVADLNFGDCFAYACAKALGVSLLYKGHDFAKTDLA